MSSLTEGDGMTELIQIRDSLNRPFFDSGTPSPHQFYAYTPRRARSESSFFDNVRTKNKEGEREREGREGESSTHDLNELGQPRVPVSDSNKSVLDPV